jgi:hypothetical protein
VGESEVGPYACQDGSDDDGDGFIDCQDPECFAEPVCPAVEHACSDGVDNDNNGAADCADIRCAWACAALSASTCAAPKRVFTFGASGLPIVIPPTARFVGGAPVFASPTGSIVAAAVRINAAHMYMLDLELYLTSPGGVRRLLTGRNGGTGTGYINTVLYDAAPGVIGSTGLNTPPFTGNYQPEEPLSAWTASAAQGLFGLYVEDWSSRDGGTLTETSLALCVAP